MTQKSLFRIFPLIALSLIAPRAMAQTCSTYYPLETGTRMEYTLYDQKDRPEGTQWQEVASVSEGPDGLTAAMKSGFADAKGKNTFESEYKIVCDGDAIRIDYQSLISGPMQDQFADAEAELTGSDLILPNRLSAGQSLPDAYVEMKIKMGGMNMNMRVDQTNRKVEGTETVQTPAGSFDCIILYSESASKMMMASQNFIQRVWLAEGVGMVKTETLNKNGKLMSRMVLTGKSG